MGLDAPSQDLTARIQARRKALVLSGDVTPALPGEHAIHGKQPGAAAAYESGAAGVSVASERRAFRAARAEEVVEMDYSDHRAEDADEPFEVGAEPEEPEPELEEETETEIAYAERVIHDDGGLLHLADVVEGSENRLHARMDEYDRGLIALAQGVGDGFDVLRQEFVVLQAALDALDALLATPDEPRGFFSRMFR